jgi:hypothetical protein
MDSKQRLQRSVWVLDINEFILYLEDCFYRISPRFPWLLNSDPIDRNWPWTETDRFTKDKTQRDHLVDWIIRKYLRELHYFDLGQDEHNEDFTQVFQVLIDEYDLHELTKYYVTVPNIYGDIHTHQVLRQSCWLYIEADIDPKQQLPHHIHGLSSPFAST